MTARAMAFESECENLVRGLDNHGNIHPRAMEWMNSVSIIPIAARSKKPPEGFLWKEFTERKATAEERAGWRKRWPGVNYALVCGSISGVVVLDFDKEPGRELFAKYKVAGTAPVSITPGGGFHALYMIPDEPIGNATAVVPGLDVRGEGGYIVIPPSVHPNGKKYQWQVAPWVLRPAPPLPAWFWELWNAKLVEESRKPAYVVPQSIGSILSFTAFAQHHGCETPAGGWIADGTLHRCPAQAPDGRWIEKDGSYLIHHDKPVNGFIQNHHRHQQMQQWRPSL